jgi:arginyl-tRNA synthetase
VSANPTGPLHVGHGRGAAYGATVADLLSAVGYTVDREYYLNDAGRQMDILATSVYLRYLECCGETLTFPSNGYRGDYIQTIAHQIFTTEGSTYRTDSSALFAQVPADEPQGGDREQHIDGLIAASKAVLGDAGYDHFHHTALTDIRADIEQDLREFGIEYQCWFSERSLATGDSQVQAAIKALSAAGHTEHRDGALWFRSTTFGDDKDRVLQRENGQTTYFASDIAYHQNKFARGYDTIINIWGADHHGYITRVKAAMTALGYDAERLVIPMVQFANLYRGEEKLAMSTRSGSFVTLRELREEVGNDAARYIYVTRKVDQPMDFDLELAKSQSKDNPVYYVQYAHARVCSMLQKLSTEGVAFDLEQGLAQVPLLQEPAEQDLLSRISQYPDVLRRAALAYEPHQLANYLRELAGVFHAWYNATRVLVDDDSLRAARVTLALAVRQIIANGLELLGVSAPESM